MMGGKESIAGFRKKKEKKRASNKPEKKGTGDGLGEKGGGRTSAMKTPSLLPQKRSPPVGRAEPGKRKNRITPLAISKGNPR